MYIYLRVHRARARGQYNARAAQRLARRTSAQKYLRCVRRVRVKFKGCPPPPSPFYEFRKRLVPVDFRRPGLTAFGGGHTRRVRAVRTPTHQQKSTVSRRRFRRRRSPADLPTILVFSRTMTFKRNLNKIFLFDQINSLAGKLFKFYV